MYAVIKTGGKQYRVAAGDKIQIEKLVGNPGDAVEFTEVLMVANGESVKIGAPLVAGATVSATVLSQSRHDKVRIFKDAPPQALPQDPGPPSEFHRARNHRHRRLRFRP